MKPRLRPPLLSLLVFGFFLSCGHAQESAPPSSPKRPNVLFLFADDLACDGVHAFGGLDVKTPNLDRLAARGTIFTDAHNMGAWNGAVCIASRAMLLTGRSLWHARAVAGRAELEAENTAGRLWPGMMRAAGYRTFMAGKWHNEIAPDACFDVVRAPRVMGMPGTVKSSYNRPPADGGEDVWSPTDTSLGGYWQGGRHWTEVTAETAVGFIHEATAGAAAGQTQSPYFAYVAFNAPHDPRQSPQEFLDLYKTENITVPENFLPEYPWRNEVGQGPDLRDEALAAFPRTPHAVQVHRQEYYALISHLDAWVGKILEAVEKSGQADNTLIIFTADHGLALGRHGFMGKQSLYDHSTRVPLILSGPGVPAGGRVQAPVYFQDTMATALEAAGAAKTDHVEFHSLLPLLQPDAAQAKDKGRKAIYGSDPERQRSITVDGWKLLVYPTARVLRLYHLAGDPLEMKDLAADPEQKDRMASLFQALRDEQAALDDPLDLKLMDPAIIKSPVKPG
ncbi:DUF229 domain-containing protein [bacterium]|nr:MAG: DUF229 domain-containing protein [bacterium]